MAWYDLLLPASWRGIPFGVRGSEYGGGRRTALHSYPYRDKVWVEDLGRFERRVTFSGFLVGDGAYARAKLMLRACEVSGPGTLVHPSLGIMRVALVAPVRMVERAERGGLVELQFEFSETLDPTYPAGAADTVSAVLGAIDRTLGAISDSFVGELVGAAVLGVGIITSVQATVSAWGDLASSLARDAGLTTGAVKGVTPDSGTYGRYSQGSRSQGAAAPSSLEAALDAVVAARSAVDAAADQLAAVAAAGQNAGLVPSAFAVSEAIRDACADPTDAVRLLARLASYTVTVVPTDAPLGSTLNAVQAATAAACRQAALCSLAIACAEYLPASHDEGQALQEQVSGLLRTEELRIGEASSGGLYPALSQIRTLVLDDLAARGAPLPRLRTVTTPQAQASLVVAYALYADASRSDELIRRANPPHPGFMPTEFQALTD
ncbi:MAG TPA: DNA circularization N-terminal domain-containing protein [Geminicoccus sp.]|uniref:DNA circularization protein n=1 Tax=Geminicoccus sp. TaxID=2024832 RepID=UPI002B73F39E|nr:DNA circularization N-terminal domain-containing protein [Geminicoccus sp.]HWL72177.1 DNA circularization N-terminal domain-containing protein [Geminicoccus sp.]